MTRTMCFTTQCPSDPDVRQSRRAFVFQAGASLGLLWLSPTSVLAARPGITYRALMEENSLRVVSGTGAEVQRLPSLAPVSLTLHPSGESLYVVNDIAEHEGLPRGTVESYAVDGGSGRLTMISRQPLSLSGTRPKALALSPDGRCAVIAIHSGRSYNVLPVGPDGALGRPIQIYKEIDPARPSPDRVVFDKNGRFLLAGESDSRRTAVFRFRHGRLSPVTGMEVWG